MTTPPDKTCATCGRRITWRKKWARDWDDVRHCSAGCKRRPPRSDDRALERAILELLEERGRGKTVCPSEAAKRVFGAGPDDPWRGEMERTRRAARRLVAAGVVEITQRGRVVDPSTARGPIRLRRTSSLSG